MKNLKKIAALVVVLALALGSVAFASFSDVAEDASYNEAVTVMSSLGLLKGYEDGTFGPDKTITRAEFAAVIVRALGMEEQANGASANTIFTDVPSSEWFAGYIQIANQQQIIAGYGDGTFGPNDEVTYEQAVKMIVCALGYAPKFANVPDAYPTSYLAQANTSGITVGAAGKIGDKATRAIVARLVYNALDVPMMEQTSFGSDVQFSVPDNYKTLLSNNLKVAKVDATVEKLYFNSDDADKVGINITAVDDCYYRADNQFEKGEKDFYFADGVEFQKGYTCVAYIDFNDDDAVIKAIVPKSNKNKTIVISDTQAKDGFVKADKLGYYKTDSDTDSSTTDVKLEDTFKVYTNKNSAETAFATFATEFAKGSYKQVTLIDNDNNSKYDYAFVTEYTAGVVDEISARSYKLTFNGGDAKTLKLDPEAEDYIFEIKDADGNKIAFEDIKVGDVVNVVESVDGSDKYYEVTVSEGKLTGTVSEVLSNGKIVIDGKEYDAYGVSVSAGDAGVFTVDQYDRILKYELDGGNRKFGLAYKGYIDDDGVDNEPKLLMYTTDGKYVTYTFAKNVKIASGTVKNSDIKLNTSAIFDTVKIAMYVTNSADEITEIYYDDEIKAKDKNYELTTATDVTFNETSSKVGSLYLVDSTKIIANDNKTLKNDDKADYALSDASIFVDDDDVTKYSYVAIKNTDKELVFVVVNDASPKPARSSKPMYVTSTGDTTDADGASAKSVTGYVDGEKVTIVVTSDTKRYNVKDAEVKSDVAKGDVIQYAGEGEVSSVRFIFTAADYKAMKDGDFVNFGKESDKGNGFALAGSIAEYRNGTATIKGKDYAFRAATPGMLVRLDDKDAISKIYTNNIDITSAETDKDYDGKNDDIVAMYKYDDEEIAVVIVDVDSDTDF